MAWITENRREEKIERRAQPYLTEELKAHLAGKYFPRYPNRRAVLLPALHCIQHEYGWIPPQAMEEVAVFLQLSPAEVLDTASFYEEYWLKPKGKYLLQVCRSISCELCGSRGLLSHLIQKLKIEPGETTPDGKFTLIEVECLGSCGSSPVVRINHVLNEHLTPQSLDEIMANLPDNPADYTDPVITWNDPNAH